MDLQSYKQTAVDIANQALHALMQTDTYAQFALVLAIYWFTFVVTHRLRKFLPLLVGAPMDGPLHPLRRFASKLLEVSIFILIFLLLLQVMGINLTALAVFGGALGVGLGFGLQAIASNFISGIIILLDRSISVGNQV